ncbi:MAG: helix-hairpin-helix domain-containing protein [Paracoccaceae bacterium]|nr:helix-hairpin-helix domain-containing protein [Paracoccaceae bacterium]
MSETAKIKGIGPASAGLLAKHGFVKVKDVANACVADLTVVPKIGQIRAHSLITAAQELLNGASIVRASNMEASAGKKKGKKTKKNKKGKSGKKKEIKLKGRKSKKKKNSKKKGKK